MKVSNINIRISEDEKKILKLLAKENKMTLSKYLVNSGLAGRKLKVIRTVEVGLEKIKKPKQGIEWTEEMVKEFTKCYIDPVYFALTYCKIPHPVKGIVPFEMRPYQVKVLRKCIDKDRTVMLLPRQSGKTTISAIYALHKAMFSTENQDVLSFSVNMVSATSYLQLICSIYDELPAFLKKGMIERNKTSIVFEGNSENERGSSICVGGISLNASRGRSASILILDEFAYVPRHIAEEFWTCVIPTVAVGGKIIVISSSSGNNSQYDKLYTEAVSGENDFSHLTVDVSEVR